MPDINEELAMIDELNKEFCYQEQLRKQYDNMNQGMSMGMASQGGMMGEYGGGMSQGGGGAGEVMFGKEVPRGAHGGMGGVMGQFNEAALSHSNSGNERYSPSSSMMDDQRGKEKSMSIVDRLKVSIMGLLINTIDKVLNDYINISGYY